MRASSTTAEVVGSLPRNAYGEVVVLPLLLAPLDGTGEWEFLKIEGVVWVGDRPHFVLAVDKEAEGAL